MIRIIAAVIFACMGTIRLLLAKARLDNDSGREPGGKNDGGHRRKPKPEKLAAMNSSRMRRNLFR
jgi:hypothetical protein